MFSSSIIREFKLKPVKVYCEAGKQLAKAERYSGIGQLVSCIKSSGTSDIVVTDMCDEMLTLAVATFTKANVSGTKVEDLIKLISDRSTKVSNSTNILYQWFSNCGKLSLDEYCNKIKQKYLMLIIHIYDHQVNKNSKTFLVSVCY